MVLGSEFRVWISLAVLSGCGISRRRRRYLLCPVNGSGCVACTQYWPWSLGSNSDSREHTMRTRSRRHRSLASFSILSYVLFIIATSVLNRTKLAMTKNETRSTCSRSTFKNPCSSLGGGRKQRGNWSFSDDSTAPCKILSI